MIALHQQALHDRRSNRVFFAQLRQRVFSGFALFRGKAGGGLGIGGLGDALPQNGVSVEPGKIGFTPAAKQQQPFGTAQFFADLAVSRRLFCLPDQHRQLLRQTFQHIIDPQQVRLGPRQFQLGLMPPCIQTTDPGRLFQHPAAGFGFGVYQFRNLPLPHQSRGMRAGRGVGKQHLHVTRPHFFGVQLVGRPGIAGDPAHNFDLIGIVKTRRGQPFRIIHHQRHFSEMPRAAGGGTVKDHVLHPAATHCGGAVFAHHPPHRFQQIGFAAAVRANHTGQPVVDHQIGGVHKAFEAVQPQPGKAQIVEPCDSVKAVMVWRGTTKVNALRH